LIGVVEMHRRQEIRRPRRDTGKSDTAVEKVPKTKVFLSMRRVKFSGRQAADWDDKKASQVLLCGVFVSVWSLMCAPSPRPAVSREVTWAEVFLFLIGDIGSGLGEWLGDTARQPDWAEG